MLSYCIGLNASCVVCVKLVIIFIFCIYFVLYIRIKFASVFVSFLSDKWVISRQIRATSIRMKFWIESRERGKEMYYVFLNLKRKENIHTHKYINNIYNMLHFRGENKTKKKTTTTQALSALVMLEIQASHTYTHKSRSSLI